MSEGDIVSLWAKKVTVAYEAGDEVEVIPPEAAEAVPDETEAMDPEEDEEPEPKKARKSRPVPATHRLVTDKTYAGAKRAYERAVATKSAYRGHVPPIADADLAEGFGAWFRLAIMGEKSYGERRNDLAIISSTKALNTLDNTLGGATVPTILESELIANRAKYSAAMRAIGYKMMSIGQNSMPRLIDDVSVSVRGEGATGSAQDKPEFDQVEMHTRTIDGFVRVTEEIINDSAINIVGTIGDSFTRAYGKFEDINFLLSRSATGASASFQGILDKIGSNSTFDAAHSTGWTDFVYSDYSALEAKLSDRSYDNSHRVGLIMSRAAYGSMFKRVAAGAGGNTGVMLMEGMGANPFDADAMWDGIPVWFTPVLPRSYTGDQKSVLLGAFDAACKIGFVTGSEKIATSEHVAFMDGVIVVRASRRLAFNAHDVNDINNADTGSMVVALQD
jgi:HK97 family phage major capsid protein